ncbi:hypothetical protein 2050HW_00335 [Serratia phage vB_SmaM_ 2050HW]|uniref:Uncharacterized protein n=1 Tax=Serratia phage vB_SmaM_ 2050HW TaxID=2024252 RepID=A0A289ZWC9_9CAUD|nr:hypothetical protein HWB23_gp335 [Serratia phage vB_SmaM_ 2050HW]ATA65670.1 hypothetical protein 2050HW_00335 [Serratia phage vB_SmaM_ 2050HW]
MGYYSVLIFFPGLLIILGSKYFFPRQITRKEFMVQLGCLVVSTAIATAALSAGQLYKTSDFNILNGVVTDKKRVEVSCEHQYQCDEICSGTGKNRSCTPVYCDEHDNDWDYNVYTTVGKFEIKRLDDQGARTPPRWLAAKIGEPAAKVESVTNYTLIDDERYKAEEASELKYKGKLPDYPKTEDYYRYNRIVNTTPFSFGYLNNYLNRMLIEYGAKKQLNVILVITENDPDYWKALRSHWKGVRKNDVVLVYGIGDNNEIKWFEAETFADGEGNRRLIIDLEGMARNNRLGYDLVHHQFEHIVTEYVRKPNAEFAYMASNYSPPIWWIVLIIFINMLVTGGVAIYFKDNRVF